MDRMEWELVPKVRPDRREAVEAIAEEILELDGILEIKRSLTREQEERLMKLQAQMATCLLSPCVEAQTPMLRARDQWRETASGIFSTLPGNENLDEELFLKLMGQQHDCALCDGRTAFPGVSGVPCEFDLTLLGRVIPGDDVLDTVQFELQPEEMLRLAGELEVRLRTNAYQTDAEVDGRLYLTECIRYLRFWARLDFGVAPAWVEAE